MAFYGHGYAGHSAWMIVVVVAVTLAVRLVASRGRGGPWPGTRRQRSGPPSTMSFTRPPPGSPLPPDRGTGAPSVPVPPEPARPSAYPGYTGIPAGWLPDPTGKHQQRYWSGFAWSEHVTDDGVPAVDPMPVQRPSGGGEPTAGR